MTDKIKVIFEKIYPDVKTPVYATKGAAGCDVHAYITIDDSGNTFKVRQEDGSITAAHYISEGCTAIIKTGLKMAIPEGYEIQVRPRSGLSAKTKLRIANSPGTLDFDYRGEVGIIVDNIGVGTLIIKHGERIAQLVLAPVFQAEFEEGDIGQTERGEGGFGSTGVNTKG